MVDKADTIAGENLTARMQSARYRHKDTACRLHGWVRDVMVETLTSISRRRGSALALVNLASPSHIASWVGLLQGHRRQVRFCGLDGIVLDADTNAACNIRARPNDDEMGLFMPHWEIKALLVERTGIADGSVHPQDSGCQGVPTCLRQP